MNGNNPEKQKSFKIFFILKEKLKPGIIFILLFSAYIIVNTAVLSVFKIDIYDVENNININILYFIGALAAIFCVLLILYIILWKIKNFHRYVLFFSSAVFAVGLVANKNLDVAYCISIFAVLFYIINYCFHRRDEWTDWEEWDASDANANNLNIPDNGINFDGFDSSTGFNTLMILISVLVLAFTVVMSETCIARYLSFRSSTFDFGIFAQMFENMAKTGLQITSVERNVHLSHFAVHFSPFYYVILPFYMIFRSPESLLVIQALAAGLGAIPLALIAKKFKLSNSNILLTVTAYLFYPALSGGLFFDFHENKFLTVLILWLLYFIISVSPENSDNSENSKKYLKIKYILIYVFAILTLTVKEDSFLYVFFIALYMASLKKDGKFSKNNIIHGTIIAAMSVIYFFFSTYYLKNFGLGVMTYRFNLFLRIGEDSFITMILNVFKNPALLFASLLSTPEKLEFIFYMLIPLCFLPFISKKLNFILLIIPMIVINLATDYIYQYDVHFQYTYGVTALLFFLAVKNLSKINIRHITKLCVAMACFSIILFTAKNFNRIHAYNFIYFNFTDEFTDAEAIISKIPLDSSISASTFLVPHLIKCENLYKVEIGADDYFDYDTEYLVIDLRDVETEIYSRFARDLNKHGYKKIDAGLFIEVFRKVQDAKIGGGG